MKRSASSACALAWACAWFWCSACGDDALPDAGPIDAQAAPDAEEPDAGHDDAKVPDSGEHDAGPPPDAGMPFNESTCQMCGTNGACPGSGQCLSSNGVSFCADPCDSDLFGCVTGFTCLDIDPDMTATSFFCIPPSASCVTPGVGYGTACYGDTSSCLTLQHACEGDRYALGYCTEACGVDGDCPPGFACRPGDDGEDVCKPRYRSGPERCGRDDDRPQLQCSLDVECVSMPGTNCIRSEPTLPGVCAVPCPESAPCVAGTCLNTLRGAFCLDEPCTCHGNDVPAGTRDLLGEALESVGLTRCGTIFSVYDWASTPPDILNDPYRLGFYDQMHNEPLRSPVFAREVVSRFDGDAALVDHPATKAARMVEHLADLADRPAITHEMGELDPVEPLATAVAALITLAGGTPDEGALRADAADVPMDLQLAVARVVDGMMRAVVARRNAIETASPMTAQALFDFGAAYVAPRADGRGLSPTDPTIQTVFNATFQYGEMYGAAVDVLDAVAAAELERFAVPAGTSSVALPAVFVFSAETPVGRVAIGDGANSYYEGTDAWALLVDLGGDDEYRVPVAGNITLANSVSVLVDLGGDDFYGYVEVPTARDGTRLVADAGGRYSPRSSPMTDNGPISFSQVPRQGGARVGTAVLVDVGGGQDRYQSLRMSQGAGVFGAGVLVDDGGDDVYLAEAVAQGAGSFGIGLLFDGGGNDERRAYTMAQGFGFARGAGAVYDVDGDDQYLMDAGDPAFGGDPLYFNAQKPGLANSTLGQGFGFGRRDDQQHGYMSGGIGILIDRTGTDRYRGSVFAQGGGYWFGTGILADESGDDSYDAIWYGMATGAHYSAGFLLEGGGNDSYGGTLPRSNVTIGAGHDYSIAFLIEESGHDIYEGSRITVGAGNSNGMGFFVDNGGNDTYAANNNFAFGSGALAGSDVNFPGSPRRSIDVVGVFLDAGGEDSYRLTVAGDPINLGIADSRSWVLTFGTDPQVQMIQKGAGVDGEGETSLHARW